MEPLAMTDTYETRTMKKSRLFQASYRYEQGEGEN